MALPAAGVDARHPVHLDELLLAAGRGGVRVERHARPFDRASRGIDDDAIGLDQSLAQQRHQRQLGRPLRLEITRHLRPGANTIRIEPFAPASAKLLVY